MPLNLTILRDNQIILGQACYCKQYANFESVYKSNNFDFTQKIINEELSQQIAKENGSHY